MAPYQHLDDSDDSQDLASDVNEDRVSNADTDATEIDLSEDIHINVEGQINPNMGTTDLSELVASLGVRPGDILRLRFKNTRIVVARRPDGGPHNLLIQFAPEFTKE
jgi:hypothetical protein